jgi:hypothetical protein
MAGRHPPGSSPVSPLRAPPPRRGHSCDFAVGMGAADHRRPQAASKRDSTRLYQPENGPFSEDAAVAMTLAEMRAAHDGAYAVAGKRRYPSGRSVCDLATGELPDWAIEVKLARLGRLITSGWALRKALQPVSRRTARRRLPSRSAWPAHYPSQILPDRLMHVREQVSGLCKVHPPHCS